jgi:hypothetical protein
LQDTCEHESRIFDIQAAVRLYGSRKYERSRKRYTYDYFLRQHSTLAHKEREECPGRMKSDDSSVPANKASHQLIPAMLSTLLW